MVVDQVNDARADELLHALADATRRDILRRAMHRGHPVSALAQHYPMSFAAVQKHVAVLHRAGLVTKQRSGRQRLVRTDIAVLRQAALVLDELEALWRGRIDRMDALLAEPTPDDVPATDPPAPEPPQGVH